MLLQVHVHCKRPSAHARVRRSAEGQCFQLQGWHVQWVLAPVCTDSLGWAEKHGSVKISICEIRKGKKVDFLFRVFYFFFFYLRFFVSTHHHFLEYCWRIRHGGTNNFPVPTTKEKKNKKSCLGMTPWHRKYLRSPLWAEIMWSVRANSLFREVVQIHAS